MIPDTAATNNDRLIPFARVQDIVGLKRTRIYRLIRESGFPAPYKPGGTGSRWSEAEVRAWIEGSRDQGIKGSRDQGIKGSRDQGIKGTRAA
jgi:prophage regulatory protein